MKVGPGTGIFRNKSCYSIQLSSREPLHMSKAKIAAKEPAVLTLDPGTYYWCACGLSNSQPFCDGSHKGTDFKPLVFEISTPKKVALCQCKQTDTPPFCDGSHNQL